MNATHPFSTARQAVRVLALSALLPVAHAALGVTSLRTEYLPHPLAVEDPVPRLSWRVESDPDGPGAPRSQRQTAYRVLVARTAEALARDRGDLWDSGRVATNRTTEVAYAGPALSSRARCHWKVQVWDQDGAVSAWSPPASWAMGLLRPDDWRAQWISFGDPSPLHTNRNELCLPPARHYRKEFRVPRTVRRATVYAAALGLYELHLNGQRVGDAYFTPGWSDYGERVYYNAFDVTPLVRPGANALGAIVADGWYAGYVGYGLLVGYGPGKTGRNLYGKTPALRVQLEIELSDGSRQLVATDPSWQVSGEGPIREADLIMGENFDARRDWPGWAQPGFATAATAAGWAPAVRAEDNGRVPAVFSDTTGERPVDLGFVAPRRLQAYSGPPIRITEELKPVRQLESKPGVHIYDLGQNLAGIIRLKVRGPAGTRVRIRYGEMLHPDGRLMTENLRRARATDFYTLRGDPGGETWMPRFTYHGFQFVELTGLAEKPAPDAVTGLALHSDTPLASAFECSDPVINRLYKNITWTQRANFVEIPTDCPQRDERLGWMGDAQIYARAATYNADVAAFFTKWLDDVQEAQRSFGAYPDYAPYPMSHGEPRKSFGTAWMDAGIICPWTMHQAYGDTRVIARHYESMRRFMAFRTAVSPKHLGVSVGNPWGDWLNLNEPTPVEYVDVCYYAHTARLMAEMAEAIGRPLDAADYRRLRADIQAAFQRQYVQPDGALSVDTQTAYVLALAFGLLPDPLVQPSADRLAAKIQRNDGRMATGFLGTKPLLPVLTAHGHHDLALRLFQSRRFPSWGYEVVNGATSIWERWDSFTKEDGFGRHNAAMNSFSHYSFGAVCEWMFQSLAGIDTDGPGFARIVLRPGPDLKPAPGAAAPSLTWVKARYDSIRGPIHSAWRLENGRFFLDVSIPANTTATVYLPTADPASVRENGRPLDQAPDVRRLGVAPDRVLLAIGSGRYAFEASVAQ